MLQSNLGDMLLTPNRNIFTQAHVKYFLNTWKEIDINFSSTNMSIPTVSEFLIIYPDIENALMEEGNFLDILKSKLAIL